MRADRSLTIALRGNATAFGYSVTITSSFGAVQCERGQPHYLDLLLYGVGAVVAFTALGAVASRGFRVALRDAPSVVLSLGTALSFVSVAAAITAALGVASALRGAPAWFAAAVTASLVFVLVESVEFMVAEWLQERRGEATEEA